MFTGTGTALVTPFRRDGSLDEPALRVLIKRQIEAGVDFLVPCGTTGESPTLTHEEHLRVVKITVELARVRRLSSGAQAAITPRKSSLSRVTSPLSARTESSPSLLNYNKPTQEGLFQHYRAIAEAVPLPIILYSVQGRTGVNIEPGTVKRLSEIENIVGIKEASGNVSQMAAILNAVPESFIVLSGDDAITLPLVALGGRGVISVVSNEIPAEMSQLTRLALQGDFPAARAIHRRYHALMEINFVESNPIPVKAAMAEMGLLEPVWRLPLVPPRRRIRRASGACSKRSGWSAARRPCPRSRGFMLPSQIERLLDEAPAHYEEEHFWLFRDFKAALKPRRDSRCRTGCLREIRLARERLGEKGNPAWVSNGCHR